MSDQPSLGQFTPPFDHGLSQFHTPGRLARRIVEWAGVTPGTRVLEPNAGGGNIVRELLRVGAAVTAVEIDPAWAAVLRSEFPEVRVECRDFLDEDDLPPVGPFDVAVLNPPFTGGVAGEHISRALDYAPRAVSVIRSQDLHGRGRWETLWSRCGLAGIRHCVRRPVFSGSGGQIEISVVDVRREWGRAGRRGLVGGSVGVRL